MKHLMVVGILLLGLSGCVMKFKLVEYPLRDGLIPALDIKGDVSIRNDQDSKKQAIIYSYLGSKLASDYNAITQLMVDQSIKEVRKNGKFQPSSQAKTIDLNVDFLISRYKAFFWKSELHYTARLGNSQEITKTVTHGSGILAQDLNGCIAESVINLLNDPKVQAYLAE